MKFNHDSSARIAGVAVTNARAASLHGLLVVPCRPSARARSAVQRVRSSPTTSDGNCRVKLASVCGSAAALRFG